MPLNMIRKSAIVNAQREAFPDALGALYTEDDADVTTSQGTTEDQAKQEIKKNANSEVIDIEVEPDPDDMETGEIKREKTNVNQVTQEMEAKEQKSEQQGLAF